MKMKRTLAIILTLLLAAQVAAAPVYAVENETQLIPIETDNTVPLSVTTLSLTEDYYLDRPLIVGSLNLNGHKLVVEGDLTLQGNADLTDSELYVKGNFYHYEGMLSVSSGKLTVDGDYDLRYHKTASDGSVGYYNSSGVLQMTDADGYMKVGGDMYVRSNYGEGDSYNKITNGTLELKGNFTQEGSGSCFNAADTHKVIFTGDKTQTVYFTDAGSSGFGTISTNENANPNVDITKGAIRKAQSGAVIKNFVQYGTLDLTGSDLTVTGDFTQSGSVTVGGKLNVGGNYYHFENMLSLGGGTLDIGGDYSLRYHKEDSDGVKQYYNSSGVLQMTDPKDYMKVGGNMYVRSSYGEGDSYNKITNGTLELKGNFTQEGSSSCFKAADTHKVIFTGSKTQTVYFTNAGSSGFGTILTSENANPNVDITKGAIRKAQSGAVIKNFVQYGTLDLTGSDLTVTGDFTQSGSVTVGGKLNVGGNYYHFENMLSLGGGTLDIGGDYSLRYHKEDSDGNIQYYNSSGVLQMTNAKDHMKVGGDMYVRSNYSEGDSYNKITNGTLELKGNFTQEGSSSCFNAADTHKVIFTGSKTQTVYFTNAGSSGFGTILTSENANPNVDITKGAIRKAQSGAVIKNFVQYGTLDLTGSDLTVTGDFTQSGSVTVGGKLNVGGNYYHFENMLSLGGGTLDIGGDYSLRYHKEDSDGNIQYYNSSGVLQMTNAKDHMKVGGDMYVRSNYSEGDSYNKITNGTLELKGNFTQEGSSSCFNAADTHKVIFTGEKTQTVYFTDAGSSGFGTILRSDESNPDVDITQGRILKAQSGAVVKNFVQYGTLDLTGSDLTVTGDFTEWGNVTVGGNLKVNGNYYHFSNMLSLGGGTLDIGGDYSLRYHKEDSDGNIQYYNSSGVLQMTNAKDHMKVGGDMYVKSYYGEGDSYNKITNGTLELKGNFTQEGSGSCFNAAENHKVRFIGDKTQTVYFTDAGSSGFGTLITSKSANADVDITKGRILKAEKGAVVKNFVQYGTLDLTGGDLTVTGDFTEWGNVTVGGNLKVNGNYYHFSNMLSLGGGTLDIGGDYSLRYHKEDSDGVKQYYNSSGVLQMTDPKDYMKVGGDMYLRSNYSSGKSYNYLCDGTLELKGDFLQSNNGFAAFGNHKTILTGTDSQTISSGKGGFAWLLTPKDKEPANNFVPPISFAHIIEFYSLVNFSDMSADTVYENYPVTVYANAVGGEGPYAFFFYVQGPDDTEMKLVSSGAGYGWNFSYTPSKVGTYTLSVIAQDGKGAVAEKSFTLTSKKVEELVNKSTLSAASITLNDSVTLRGSAEGGISPYKYAYYYKKSTDSSWTKLVTGSDSAYVSAESTVFKPTEEGTYNIKINVKDSTGKAVSKDFTLKVKSAVALTNNSSISAASANAGSEVTLSGSAEGGTSPYRFAYYYKKASDSSWTKLVTENGSAYVSAVSAVFKPTEAGSYSIRINVKDSTNKTVSKDFTLTVKAADTALANKSTVSASTASLGSEVTLSGKAEGGTSPYKYAYYYKKTTESTWTKAYVTSSGSAYTKYDSVTFKPTAAGTYDIRINVRDEYGNGKTVTKDFKLTVTSDSAELTNNSTVSATTVTAGTEITMTGKAEGGTSPYKYAYYYKKSTDSAWTKAYVTSSGSAYTKYDSKTFTPKTAGTYNVRINVRDEYGNGKTVTKDFTITVK